MYATPERTTSRATAHQNHAPKGRPSGRDLLRRGALGTQLIRLAEMAGRPAAPDKPGGEPEPRVETGG